MTGANYTGGKRNVARTRFRDSTRRIQKNHFGSRRLGVLSRSLVSGIHGKQEETNDSGISAILLEHAQREFPHRSVPLPARKTEALGALTSGSSSSTGPYGTSSNAATPNLGVPHILGDESYSSLREEVNRVLEFSRTVGLCNYLASPTPASLTSRLSPEAGRQDPQQRHENLTSPTSRSSGMQHPRTCVGHASQNSEDSAMPQIRTPQSSSFGGVFPSDQAHEGETDLVYFEPSSEYDCLEYSVSESPARSACEVEPQLGHDKASSGILERSSHQPDPLPLPPSFAALEFPTSPLPPSSPLPSSTAYGSLLSRRHVSHGPETTTLGWDSFPLPSTLSGSREARSSSRYGHDRPMTPDLAPGSPLRYLLPHSAPAHRVPNLRASFSKDELIPELLTCDNPWNAIGDILGLPPIPPADDRYFSTIRSRHTLSHEGVSSPASSRSLVRVDIGEPSRAPRHAGTQLQLRAAHSDGDLIRPGPSRLAPSREALHRTSPLPCQDPSTQRFLSPAVPFHSSGCGARSLLGRAASRRSSSPSSESISALSGASRSLLETQCPVASPRPLEATSGTGWERSPTVEKTLSPFSCILTPQGSIPPHPKNLNSPTTSVSHTPEVMSRPTAEFDLAALIPKVPHNTHCRIEAQLPKLECPDLFQDDDEDSLGGMF
ncbi:hypothetical protein BC826DRAFT_1183456 [Russula brevipes]|nr:hypothetical protein BC826DRAFT_1183456 [Russula brevipes]